MSVSELFPEDPAGPQWVGANALAGMLKPIAELRESEGNPRRGDVEAIAESLKRFGQLKPIVVDEEDKVTIRAGHHMVKAALTLGWTHIAAAEANFATPSEARAFLLADNRLSELGSFDPTQQLSLLEELERSGNWSGTGFSIDDAEDLRAQLSLVAEAPSAGDWQGGSSEDASQAAERAAALAASQRMHERVLMLTSEQDEELGRCIRILQPAYGTNSTVATIMQAIAQEALRHAPAPEQPAEEEPEPVAS